ncbi:FadR/GntR family transcriptional regulator [Paracoccus laeviglucosivorans]|uniref:DNA-binding transcriptional regulator, FadR family n=1 Tax=Paracoccus laeviglucosivorans TaxID=1197861 RepID=A0A521FJT1_9RHOB|nr:FadR/GntR family transcriptional regulator [Paracoccus laeviglucosivorans]SMO96359.1 DNA-binding transcriptional regulator, FadR family [Paracoccus laeviglucosivorans]
MESLSTQTIRKIQSRIQGDGLAIGDKLGTLSSLSSEYGVSRTVIREAVAALTSDGVLTTRHGVGVFVARDAAESARRDHGSLLQSMSQFSGSFMDMLELRMAFEVHAAGLAAVRRSLAQEAAIWATVRDFELSAKNDAVLDDIDFQFHQAIIQATNNAAFIEFFALMGARILPASTFSRALHPTLITDTYIDQTTREHRVICERISDGDQEGSRDAMRAHLTRAHDRYRGIVFQNI